MSFRLSLPFCRQLFLPVFAFQLFSPQLALAQDEPTVSDVITGFSKPVCIAIQPKSGAAFVADAGSHEILKVLLPREERAKPSKQIAVRDLSSNGDPIGIVFLEQSKLAVAQGTKVNVFKVAESYVAEGKKSLWTIEFPSTASSPAIGGFDSLAVGFGRLFWTTTGDPNLWLATARNSDEGTTPSRWVALADSIAKDMIPSGTAFAPDGHLLVAAQSTHDKSSAIYFVATGQKTVRGSFAIAQPGLRSIAYSPNSARLFALFQSDDSPERDGLYKLVARKRNTECEARLITKLNFPTSMAFAKDGTLYVTLAGDEGKLVRIDGLDSIAQAETNETTKSGQ